MDNSLYNSRVRSFFKFLFSSSPFPGMTWPPWWLLFVSPSIPNEDREFVFNLNFLSKFGKLATFTVAASLPHFGTFWRIVSLLSRQGWSSYLILTLSYWRRQVGGGVVYRDRMGSGVLVCVIKGVCSNLLRVQSLAGGVQLIANCNWSVEGTCDTGCRWVSLTHRDIVRETDTHRKHKHKITHTNTNIQIYYTPSFSACKQVLSECWGHLASHCWRALGILSRYILHCRSSSASAGENIFSKKWLLHSCC